jgi:hypothetical protein
MRILTQILLFLILTTPAISQNTIENNLVGKWQVSGIQFLSKGLSTEQISLEKTLKRTFLNAHFEFKADKHFSFDAMDSDWDIKNAHWKYNPKTNTVVVQEWKDRNVAKPILMEILVKPDGSKLVFLLDEAPLALQVQRFK